MTSGVQTWRAAFLTPEGTLRGRAFWSVAGALISRDFLLAASLVCAWFLGKKDLARWG
jgi:hypothetical protein